MIVVVSVVLEPEAECLLRQMSADLDLSPESLASLMLESALLSNLTR